MPRTSRLPRATTADAPAPREPDNDRGAQARAALVQAAVQIFGESGPGNASVREIAARSGQNIAAISYHFGGKQGLYLETMRHVAQVIEARFSDMLQEAEDFLETGRLRPAECLQHLERLLEHSTANSKDAEMVTLSSIIVREQTNVTDAFDVLYDGILGRLHRLGERLMAAYVTGSPDEPGFSVHYHALLSQSLGFRLARATAIRASGWKDIGRREEAEIRAVVLKHAELVLKGLRAEYQRAVPASRPRARQAPRLT
jgi:AcrR family transcriptional regulator